MPTLDPDLYPIEVGQTVNLATAFTIDGVPADTLNGVVWHVDDPKVASIDKNGNLTGLSEGQTLIWSEAGGVETSDWTLFVLPTSPKLSTENLTLKICETVKIEVNDMPAGSTYADIVWDISDPSVVSVDKDCNITGLAIGYCFIRANVGDLTSNNICEIYVVAEPVVLPDFEYEILTDANGNDYAQIVRYNGKDENLVLPTEYEGYKVKSIARGAFSNSNLLKSVTIPEGYEVIGDGAFYYCENLETVNVAPGLKRIESGAFGWCSKLSDFTIPNTVEDLGDALFAGTSIKEITVPASVKNMATRIYNIFMDSSVEKITFKCETIPENCCEGLTSLKTVVLNNNVKKISRYAFSGCTSLTNIDFCSVENIEEYAFSNCTSLKTVVLPKALKTFKLHVYFLYRINSLEVKVSCEKSAGYFIARLIILFITFKSRFLQNA